MTHKIVLPSSAYLGNFEKFTNINKFPSNPPRLELVSPTGRRLTSLHPLISSLLVALDPNLSSPLLTTTTLIKSSDDLDVFLASALPRYSLSKEDGLLTKYILAELTRNTLEHSGDPRGATIAVSYSKKSNTLRLGVADHGVGIKSTITGSGAEYSDYEAIVHALTPGVTGAAVTPGGTSENAGAGLFFVKSLAYQLGSHFLIYSGQGLFKLLKRKTVRSILKPDSRKDHASGSNNYPFYPGTAVGVDIPLNILVDFNSAIGQIRSKFYSAIQNKPELPSTGVKFI